MNMFQDDIYTLNIEDNIKSYCRESLNIHEQQFSIYRVPSHIRKNNESYYEPRMVSIGPYHQGKDHLCAMQEHKWHYLRDHINQGVGMKEDYIQEIRRLMPSIRACYFESFKLDEEQFVETMLLDSCFIIQLCFIKWSVLENDPTRSIGWALPFIMADLTMIENQIPFFVLEKIYNIYNYGSSVHPDNSAGDRAGMAPDLTTLLAKCLHAMNGTYNGPDPRLPEAGADIKHLLHLHYLLFVPAPVIFANTIPNPIVVLQEQSPRTIPRVKELQEFGVTLKRKKKNFTSFLDISFNNGVLEIPCIVAEESTRSKVLNLIAFEQCRYTDKKHLTSWAVFLACLIDTSEDVIALQKCGIIVNTLANTKEAVKFFHQLRDCAYIDYQDHYLQQVFVDIRNYCQKSWPKYRAMLSHDYFSNPWSIMAFCAASLVLCITIFKTIYFIVTTFF